MVNWPYLWDMLQNLFGHTRAITEGSRGTPLLPKGCAFRPTQVETSLLSALLAACSLTQAGSRYACLITALYHGAARFILEPGLEHQIGEQQRLVMKRDVQSQSNCPCSG